MERNLDRIFCCLFVAWVIAVVGGLGVAGAAIYTAYHFIEKVW